MHPVAPKGSSQSMTMLPTKGGKNERVFTIELKSRGCVKNVVVPNGTRGVLIEGTLGTLKHADFLDGIVLEVIGEKGVLRVDMSREDLARHTNVRKE